MLSVLERRILFKEIGFDVETLPDAIEFDRLKPLLVYGAQSQTSEVLIEQFIDDVNSERIPVIKSGLEQWKDIPNNPPDEWGGPCPFPLEPYKPEPRNLTNDEIFLYESGAAPENVKVPKDRATLINWDGSKQSIKRARQFGYDSEIHLTVTITYHFTRQAVVNWFSYIKENPNEAIALWLHPFLADKQAPSKPLQSHLEEPATECAIQSTRSNDIAQSNLLIAPSRQDDWFDAINDMTKAFHAEHGQIPNEIQAWGYLWTNPPRGYTITTGIDKGEDCLQMPSVNPLSKSAFSKRWKNYTADKSQ